MAGMETAGVGGKAGVVMDSLRDAYGDTLVELGNEGANIVVFDADLAGSTRTSKFAKAFPDRFFNMGAAEQGMVAAAAGASTTGVVPFVSTFAMFATGRAYEFVRQACGVGRQNVKIVATHAGLTVGEDGGTHQCLEDLALMRMIPGMTVISPADALETKQAIRAAYAHQGPVYVRLTRDKFPRIHADDYRFQIGKAVMMRPSAEAPSAGTDVLLVGCGLGTSICLAAAEQLAAEGIEATVLHCPTIKPFDRETLLTLAKAHKAVVTCEEHQAHGGLGGVVAEILSEAHPMPLRRVGVKDQFGQSGKPEKLLEAYGITPQAVASAAKEALQ
ncbi:transketolase family protein [Geothrix fermentans]|jgi:transketolase|uniref:transketolase family protein n=1 Tax=Geothrix fermentans TaxID=44676 RepID=UPI0003FD041F|nr:transketolase C-terminal domain-containing protein [Geothrix fermentans]